MDLEKASAAHGEWKVKLRMMIAKREKVDATTIGADNCCPLGQWLHGAGRSQYSQLGSYRDCVTKHASFHREAGQVAMAINAGKFEQAEAMLGAGTPYAQASTSAMSAILGLKKEAAL